MNTIKQIALIVTFVTIFLTPKAHARAHPPSCMQGSAAPIALDTTEQDSASITTAFAGISLWIYQKATAIAVVAKVVCSVFSILTGFFCLAWAIKRSKSLKNEDQAPEPGAPSSSHAVKRVEKQANWFVAVGLKTKHIFATLIIHKNDKDK